MIKDKLTKEEEELLNNEIINDITKTLDKYKGKFDFSKNETPQYITISDDIKLKYNEEASYRLGKHIYNPVFNIKEQEVKIVITV